MTWTARAARLAEAGALLHGDLVFGWRLALKHQLLSGRLAVLRGDPDGRAGRRRRARDRAAALRVPRYTSAARLVTHRARHALRLPVDPAAVAADLDALDQSVSIEAWWWTGELAADFGQPAWLDRAAGPGRPAGRGGRPVWRRPAAGRGPAAGPLAGRGPVTRSARRNQRHRHGQRRGPAAAWPTACATARSAARRAAAGPGRPGGAGTGRTGPGPAARRPARPG